MRSSNSLYALGKLITITRYVLESEISNAYNQTADVDEARKAFKQGILAACMEIWEAVKETLCYDSPEGYQDESNAAEVFELGLKDTLSYCWRALKESRLGSLQHSPKTV